jgi:hypothetical protein
MNPAADPGHGHSPAAWVAVIVMTSALSVGTVAFFLGLWSLVIGSAVATVAGWLLGFVLAGLGWGVKGPRYQPRDH